MRSVLSRKGRLAALALCACVGSLILLPLWPRKEAVLDLNVEIKVGMTEEEVMGLIGGPGQGPNKEVDVWYVLMGSVPESGSYSKEWIKGEAALKVNFDRERRVVSSQGGFVMQSDTWFRRILRVL